MLPGIVDEKFALSDAGRPEGIRLDDVGSSFQKSAMDIANHVRLSQGEQVPVIQQIFRRILETIPADISFLHPVGTDRRAHRSIDDGDPILEDLL